MQLALSLELQGEAYICQLVNSYEAEAVGRSPV